MSEISKRLPEWNNPRNPNGIAIQRTLLELYGKSGMGGTFDPSAYSDKDKNTGLIRSPSLTIAAEGVPGEFYNNLDDGLVSGGLLPRFTIFEYEGGRSYSNSDAGSAAPPPALVQAFADLAAQCLNLAHNGRPHVVPADGLAQNLLQSFDDETTDLINDGSEITKQLWNRAHLKALKLATLSAVSWNYLNPVVTYHDALWAISIIRRQTERLIGKFSRDEVGLVDGDESKQLAELIKAIGRYFFSPFEELSGYGGFTQDMHRDGVITETFLSRFLTKRAAFKNDRRRGPTEALKRAINNLLSGDELREMGRTQMLAKYGNHARSFVMSDPKRFADARSRELDSGSIR